MLRIGLTCQKNLWEPFLKWERDELHDILWSLLSFSEQLALSIRCHSLPPER